MDKWKKEKKSPRVKLKHVNQIVFRSEPIKSFQLSWREDRQPHQLLYLAHEDEHNEDECVAILNQ